MEVDYTKAGIFSDLVIISKNNIKLYYSRYSLCLTSEYFLKLITFNNEIKNEISLDLNTKTIIMFLRWSDARQLTINNIYVDHLIELWDFAHEIICTSLVDCCSVLIIDNLDKILKTHDIINIMLKSSLYMKPDNFNKLKLLYSTKIDMVLKSPELKNLTPDQVIVLIPTVLDLTKILPAWAAYNDNINNLSKINVNFSKLHYNIVMDLKDVILATNDSTFLKEVCIVVIEALDYKIKNDY